MPDEVRIGSLRLKFLIDDADNGGKLTMFDMTVPEQAKVPAAHYHRDFEEVWYGLGGTLTVTLDGVAHQLRSVTPCSCRAAPCTVSTTLMPERPARS
jgi:quercetin dioxygenase-like cupin family protein